MKGMNKDTDPTELPGIGRETFKIPLDEGHFHRFKTEGIEIKRPFKEYTFDISEVAFFSDVENKLIYFWAEEQDYLTILDEDQFYKFKDVNLNLY